MPEGITVPSQVPKALVAVARRRFRRILPAGDTMDDLLERIATREDWQYEEWAADFHSDASAAVANHLAVRRDMVTLLRFVQSHEVVGTRSTGNMPLKLIRQVTADFVVPPRVDQRIGEHVYKLRTEYDVWPLYFLHCIAEVGGLLTTPQGARWRLTPAGESFLEAKSQHQVLQMLAIWWFETNWMIAYPMGGLGEYLPRGFTWITLARLSAIPLGRRVPFSTFADALIARTGLDWSATWDTDSSNLLRWSIRRMVVMPGATFGILDLDQLERPEPMASKLLAFRVTPFGRMLLTSLRLLSEQP